MFSPSTSVSPAKIVYSTNFSILTITRGRYNRPGVAAVPSGPSMDPIPQYSNKKKDYEITEPKCAWKYEYFKIVVISGYVV
jgi:hypothetical protein